MSFTFDWKVLLRFIKVAKILCKSGNGMPNALLFMFLLCIALLEQVLINYVGFLPSSYYDVLGKKSFSGFQSTTIQAICLILAIAFVIATKTYLASILYLFAREAITKHLHGLYFRDIAYYNVNVLDTTVDNPDQRMTQDVNRWSQFVSQVVVPLLISPFTIAYYLYLTWQRTGYIGPLCVFAFFLISTIVNKVLMSPVVHLTYKQEELEGSFRFKHMQVRCGSESMAFLRCGQLEQLKTNHFLEMLLRIQHLLVLKQYFLSFSVNLADYLGSILSYVILAIPIFSGVFDDTTTSMSVIISQNSFVTMYLISCFTKLIDLAAQIADIAGTTHRIGVLLDRLDRLAASSTQDVVSANESSADETCGGLASASNDHPPMLDVAIGVDESLSSSAELCGTSLHSDDSDAKQRAQSDIPKHPFIKSAAVRTLPDVAFQLDNVSYSQPQSNKCLITGLNLLISQGTSILITGESGCGKSSLLRVLFNLWPSSSGELKHFLYISDKSTIFCLPQKCFFTNGSLLEQIIYPCRLTEDVGMSYSEIVQLLHDFDLQSLLERSGGLDVNNEWIWNDVISPGEMQRLSFIRLFFHCPTYAVLDEATSQLSISMEEKLYNRCKQLSITTISIGHRDTLRRFHDVELRLKTDRSWSLSSLNSSNEYH